jgi:hypothetical protein
VRRAVPVNRIESHRRGATGKPLVPAEE